MGVSKWFVLGNKRRFHQIDYPPDDYANPEDNHPVRVESEEEADEEIDEENVPLQDHRHLLNENDIRRPVYSQKVYKSVVLGNGLTVLLISDKSSSSSTAAMSISFGSFDDPLDMMGLAHLMEHMMFNGSTEYTGENAFREFVNLNGGQVFGFTDMEHSGYSFSVRTPGFEVGLKMFANMFVSPLMDIDRLKREIKTIDQEFELHKYYDSARVEQLLAYTSHNDHTFHRFTWGNSDSFSQYNPEAIRDAAMKQFKNHFVGSCMKLVIVGEDPVDKLEGLVRKYFTEIKSGSEINLASPKYDSYRWKECLWKHGVAYILESVQGLQLMKIRWIIPSVYETHAEKRPELFIRRLLCDESQGSLSYFFKSKQWITSLAVSVGHDSMFSEFESHSYSSTLAGQLFEVTMNITDSGLEHKYDMVSYVYQYFNLLKTIDGSSLSSLIKEFKSLLGMKFQCLDFDTEQLCDPTQFSLVVAVNMLKFPVSHAISLDFEYDFGGVQAIKEILGNFIPKNMRIDFFSKPFTEEGYTEPYFSSKFKQESIPHIYIQKWESSDEIDPELHLPLCNDLMPTSFWEVLQCSLEEKNEESYFEHLGDMCFYKYENQPLSEASLNIYLKPRVGVISHMISRIFFEMVNHELSCLLFKGGEAYISAQISFGEDCNIKLQLYGLAERFKDYISSIWEKFKSFEPTRESFLNVTDKMMSEFYIDSHDLVNHAAWLLSEFVIVEPFPMEHKFGVLKFITFEDLQGLVPTLLNEIKTTGVFSGRLSKEECLGIYNLFQPSKYFKIQTKATRVLSLTDSYKVFAKPIAKFQTNGLAKVYYQMQCDELSEYFNSDYVTAFLHLLKAMVDERLYCDLRLEKRLGYQVGCKVSNLCGTKGIFFYVISPDIKPKDLLNAIHAFISTIYNYLVGVDNETFNCYRSVVRFPDDSGLSHEFVNGESWTNESYAAARTCLALMEKENLLEIYEHFFVVKACIIELVIGSDI